MRKITAEKSTFEILKLMGVGLTSEVYKAFRVDSEGITRQLVALKIIKSKNDVQILKREFENLSQIRSKYCVRVLSWENLPKGHSLVLEYIEGLNLYELVKRAALDESLICEILVQIRLGLLNLHRNEVFHGDLNLKNVMINADGVVKLIDFGFGDENQQFLTPEFASPQRKAGAAPTAASDFYSLNLIASSLFQGANDHGSWQKEISRGERRRQLAKQVKRVLAKKQNDTIRFPSPVWKSKKPIIFKWGIRATVFLVLFLQPIFNDNKPKYFTLSLRSAQWAKFSINQLPYGYGPLETSLRGGRYKVEWKSQNDNGSETINIDKPVTFLLKDSVKTL